ncbi:MAG: GGDEF domain-containing protein [Oscillospiraceae bacterium]
MLANQNTVNQINLGLFKQITTSFFFILIILVSVAAFVPSWVFLREVYGLAAGVSLLFVIDFRLLVPKFPKLLLPSMYTFFALLLGLAIFHGTVNTLRGGSGTTFVAMLLIMPVAILDKRWRINFLSFIAIFTFGCLSLFILPSEIALNNITNSLVFGSFGLYIGRTMYIIRLNSIENQRLLVLQRDMDTLTRLPNRRKLFTIVNSPNARKAFGKSCGIMMLDVDLFKRFNDSQGHQKGDDCLTALGNCFSSFAKENNVCIFRFGGEEFLCLCQNISQKELSALSEKLVRLVEAMAIPFNVSPFGVVTVSIGNAQVSASGARDYEELISFADSALYAAKNSGRNISVTYKRGMEQIDISGI